MIQKIIAWSLFMMAVSPFTAPFSTCDLSALFDHPTALYRETAFIRADAPPTCTNEVLLVNVSTRMEGLAEVSSLAKWDLLVSVRDLLTASIDLSVLDSTRLRNAYSTMPAVLRL